MGSSVPSRDTVTVARASSSLALCTVHPAVSSFSASNTSSGTGPAGGQAAHPRADVGLADAFVREPATTTHE